MALPVLLAILVTLAAAGRTMPFAWTPLAFWTDPIVLEFAFGILVAIAARRNLRAGWAAPALLLAALILASLAPEGTTRALIRGIPSALLVLCALSWRALPGWLVLLGDASYALYLVHPFPMRAVRVAIARIDLPVSVAVPLYLVATLAACAALAVMLHRWVEQPILRRRREAER